MPAKPEQQLRHNLGAPSRAWVDFVVIALIAAVSMVVKPYLRAPFAFVQTSLGLPVGVFLGGIYMFWPVLAGYLVPRRGAVALTCLLQGLLALLLGLTGTLGPMAFFSYLAPGIVIEALFLLPGSPVTRGISALARGTADLARGPASPAGAGPAPGNRPAVGSLPVVGSLVLAIAASALGNVAGAATNALLFFALRGTAFTVAMTASFLTGGAGGWLAHLVGWRVAEAYRRGRHAPVRQDLAGAGRR